MAETPILQAQVRDEFGKGAARRARRAGLVPGVLYGVDHAPFHFTIDLLKLTALIRNQGVNAVLELELDGQQHLSMVKHIDQNILTLDIDHIDLISIKRGERVEVEVPVIAEGEPFSGAMLIQEVDTLRIEADVLSIPEEIVVSVEGVEAGNQFAAGDITLPEGATLVDDAELLVLNITFEEVADVPEEGEETADGAAAEGETAAE